MPATAPIPTITEEQKKSYRENGYFITEPLFEPEFTQKVSAEIDRLWDEECERVGGPYRTVPEGVPPFMIFLARRNAVMASVLRHPAFTAIARQMIGGDVDVYYDQLVVKKPLDQNRGGTYQFAFHQDNYYALQGQDGHTWDEKVFLDDTKTFQSWMAFSETTLENGTLFVLPGMHRHGLLEHDREAPGGFDCLKDPRCDESKKIPVLLKPGQLLVFSGLLPHGSGVNTSATTRKIYQFSTAVKGGRPPEYAFPLLRGGVTA